METGSHNITCLPAEVTLPPVPSQLRLSLDLVTMEGCKAELTYLAGILPK